MDFWKYSGLKNVHLMHKPNPVCQLFQLDAKTGSIQSNVGSTEIVKQDVNPKFQKSLEIAFLPTQADDTHLMFKIRDGNTETSSELGTCLVTLGSILSASNSCIECRLKNPEKGKIRILSERIEADEGDLLRLSSAAKDLRTKDRLFTAKGNPYVKIFRRRPQDFEDELVQELQVHRAIGLLDDWLRHDSVLGMQVSPSEKSAEKDPSFLSIEADLGMFNLGVLSSQMKFEVWQDSKSAQEHRFLGQVVQSLEDLLRGPLPRSFEITKPTDGKENPKSRGVLIINAVEVVRSHKTAQIILRHVEGLYTSSDRMPLGKELAAVLAQLDLNKCLNQLNIPANMLSQQSASKLAPKVKEAMEKVIAYVERCIEAIFQTDDDEEVFNPDGADNAFSFFKACRESDGISDQVQVVERKFAESMRWYSRSVWQQMEKTFEAVKGQAGLEAGARRQLARELHTRLGEVCAWKEKHPLVYKSMGGKPSFKEEWVERLEEFRSDMEAEIARLRYQGRQDLLVARLEVADALSVLDKYMVEGHRFQKMFLDGMAEVCAKNEARVQAARELIKDRNWSSHAVDVLGALFDDPALQVEASKLRSELSQTVEGLVEDATKLALAVPDFNVDSGLSVEHVQNVMKLIPELRKISKFVLNYCSQTAQESFKVSLNKIGQCIGGRILAYVEAIELLLTDEGITPRSLQRADFSISAARQVCDAVVAVEPEFCSQDVPDRITKVENCVKVELQFQDASNKLLVELEALQLRAAKMELGKDLAQTIGLMRAQAVTPYQVPGSTPRTAGVVQRKIESFVPFELDRVDQRVRAIFGHFEDGEDVRACDIDPEGAERAFAFFEACRDEDELRELIRGTERIFDENMRRYSRSVWQQMETKFDAVKGQVGLDVGARRQIARELHTRLGEVCAWKEKHPRVYKSMGGKPSFKEEWVERLEEFRSDMEVEIAKLKYQGRQDLLVARLEVAHALSALDRHLDESSRFQKMFADGMAEVCAKNEARVQAARELIKDRNWSAHTSDVLRSILDDSGVQVEASKLRSELSQTVECLIDEITKVAIALPEFNLDSESSIEYVLNVMKQIPELQKVRRFIVRYCAESTQVAFQDGWGKIQDMLRGRMLQFLNTIETFLAGGQLSTKMLENADRNVTIIGLVRDMITDDKEEDDVKVRIVKVEGLIRAEVQHQDSSKRVLQDLEALQIKAGKLELGKDLARTLSQMQTSAALPSLNSGSPCRAAVQEVQRKVDAFLQLELDRVEQFIRTIFVQPSEGEVGPGDIDPEGAERAFSFFDTCREDDNTRELVKTIERIFDENMRRYSRSVWQQMETKFDAVKGQAGLDVGARRQIARELHTRLGEVCAWKEMHPRVYKSMGGKPSFKEEWVERLEEFRSDMEAEVARLRYQGRQDLLVARLEVAHALSALDKYLDEGHRFQKMFADGMAEVCAKNEARVQAARELIKDRNWSSHAVDVLGALFDDPALQVEASKLRSELSQTVEGLVEDATKVALALPAFTLDSVSTLEHIYNVMRPVPELHKVKRHVLKLCGKSTQDGFQDALDRLREALRRRIGQFLSDIGLLCQGDDAPVEALRRAELNITIARRARDLIITDEPDFCPQEVVDRIERIDRGLKRIVEARVSAFADIPLRTYATNPPRELFRIFDRLTPIGTLPVGLTLSGASASTIAGGDLQLLRAALEAAVKKAVRDAIQQAASSADPDCPELTEIQRALPALPDNIADELATELSACREQIQLNVRAKDIRFDEALRTRSWAAVHELLEQGGAAAANRRTKLTMELDRLKRRVSDALEQRAPLSGCAELRDLASFRSGLRRVREVAEALEEVRARVAEAWVDACEFVCSGMRSSSPPQIQHCYAFAMDLIGLARNGARDVARALPDDVDWAASSELLHRAIATFYQELHEGFVAALAADPPDASTAVRALDTFSAWENFWSVVMEHVVVAAAGSAEEWGYGRAFYEATVDGVVQQMREALTADLLNEQTVDGMDRGRDAYYRGLKARFEALEVLAPVAERFRRDRELAALQRQSTDAVLSQVQVMFDEASAILDRPGLSTADLGRFNLLLQNLDKFRKHFPDAGGGAQPQRLRLQVMNRAAGLEAALLSAPGVVEVARAAVQMKVLADSVLGLKDDISRRIDDALDQYKRRGGSIPRLATELSKSGSVGPAIVHEHNCFKGWNIQIFNSKTKQHDINYVLRHFAAEPAADAGTLRGLFDAFDAEYAALLKRCVVHGMRISDEVAGLADACRRLVAEELALEDQPSPAYLNAALMHRAVPRVVAHLFAMWTVKHAAHFLEEEATGGGDQSYLLMPHAAQVVAVLCMLGLCTPGAVRRRNLVQVMTGEGKSVVMAVTAAVLALLGAEVSCACYSQILSSRDHADFRFLFEALNVVRAVHYGTFSALAERVINQRGDVRHLARDLLLGSTPGGGGGGGGGSAWAASAAAGSGVSRKAPRVLLIDEVDVFFSKELYGSQYTPSCSVRHDCITRLVEHIWAHRATLRGLPDLRRLPEYERCRGLFAPDCAYVVDLVLEAMLRDVVDFQSPPYVVKDGRIGYREHDGIATNKCVGYKTTFAYLYEAERGAVGPLGVGSNAAKANVAFHIPCGGFSFAEIPRLFDEVMGVTGTLRQLSAVEGRVVEEVYEMRSRFYMPSVYGAANNLLFNRGEHVQVLPAAEDEFAMALTKQLQDKAGGGRPVLVFFETAEALREYRQYLDRARVCVPGPVQVLTEEASAEERVLLVKRATTARAITLLVPALGRGIDFQCLDPDVREKGGLHVIQTFLSPQIAEEVQIMGRTARQGERGSYALVLCAEALATRYGVGSDELARARAEGRVYALLDARRIAYFEQRYNEDTAAVEGLRERHGLSMRFLDQLHAAADAAADGDSAAAAAAAAEARGLLRELNPPPPQGSVAGRGGGGSGGGRVVCRTLVLLDATASMRSLLAKAKATVGDMISRASEVLAQAAASGDGTAGGFEMQFAVYRNYSSGVDKILESSAWETDPERLRAFLERVRAERGQGNEAVEVGLWHANREWAQGVDMQVILIGDAPPNTPEEIRRKRAEHGGESYWAAAPCAAAADAPTELEALRGRGVPVHAFYVKRHDYLRREFEALSSATGGAAGFLDIESPDGARLLTDTVAQEILRRVGGEPLGGEYVRRYQDLFGGCSYTQ